MTMLSLAELFLWLAVFLVTLSGVWFVIVRTWRQLFRG